MKFIRQGATHKVTLGPAVAVANGYVPVTTLTLSGADEAEVILHDNATVVDISGYTWAAITTADGYYHLTLQSGISGTCGHMTVVVNDDSLILPLREDFTILEEAVYDALFAASAVGYVTDQPVNVTKWLGTAAATPTVAGVPEVDVTHWIGTAAATPTTAGVPEVDVTYWRGTIVPAEHTAGYPVVTIKDGTGTGEINTNAGAIAVVDLVTTTTTVTNQLTAAQIATGVWQDATAGDFTTASSIGKALYIANIAPGAAGGHFIAGSNAGTTTVGAWTVTGALTAGTNAIPWNASWDAEVQSEVDDALVQLRLDQLLSTGVVVDFASTVAANSVIGHLADNGAGFDRTTDSLEALRDNTGTAGAGLTAIDLPDQTMNITGNLSGSVGSVTGAVGSVTGNVGGNVTGSVGSVATGGIAAASFAASAVNAAALATDAVTEIVSAVLTTAMTESYNTDGAAPTLTQALCVIMQTLTEASTSGTTMTVKKLDGSTTALTITLNDASTPTSITRAT